MANLQETRRTARLLDLIWRISSAPRQWSRRRLAEHCQVSERQITKDLEVLRHGLRFAIQRSPEGYYFEQVPRLPTASFAFEEALALLLATRAGGRLAGVDGEALAAAVDLAEFLGRGWGLMPGVDGPVEQVVLRFQPPSASFVAEEVWHPSQRVEREPSGAVLFRVDVVVTPELRRWVYRYGREVEAL